MSATGTSQPTATAWYRCIGGAGRDRTDDLLLAKQALSQLSYSPGVMLVGLDGFEPSTPALSRRCSNQLSYRPAYLASGRDIRGRTSGYVCTCGLQPIGCGYKWLEMRRQAQAEISLPRLHACSLCLVSEKGGDPAAPSDTATLLRLHPSHETHRGKRPLLRVSLPTSGTSRSHGVTGGVYKTRERIHRDMLIHDY